MRRTVGPGRPIGIRDDSTWNVPEPEIGVVIGKNGRIAGLTIGNDVSSRDIEGANPLYLPQAKIYAGACAIGPAVFVPDDLGGTYHLTLRVTDEWGRDRLRGRDVHGEDAPLVRRARRVAAASTTRFRPAASSSPARASSHPTTSRSCPGHFVEIHVPEIGTLVNPVVRASELIEKEPVP